MDGTGKKRFLKDDPRNVCIQISGWEGSTKRRAPHDIFFKKSLKHLNTTLLRPRTSKYSFLNKNILHKGVHLFLNS